MSLVWAQVVVNHQCSISRVKPGAGSWSGVFNCTESTSQECIICSENNLLVEGCWLQLAFSFIKYNDFCCNKQKTPKYTTKTPKIHHKPSHQWKRQLWAENCVIPTPKMCHFFSLPFHHPQRKFSLSTTVGKFSFASQVDGRNRKFEFLNLCYQLCNNYCCTLTWKRIPHCPHPLIGSLAFLGILK